MHGCLIYIHVPKTAGETLNRILGRQYRPDTLGFTTLDKPMSEIETIPRETLENIRLLYGHVHHGIHASIPQDTAYITLLREPIGRVLSLYRYILREPRHPLHARLTASEVSLEEFVSSGVDKNQVENGQTRQIAGVQEGDPTSVDLEAAKQNLRGCLVVGLTEHFDESLILMRRALSWRTPFYISRNVSPGTRDDQRPSYSEKSLDQLREKNQLDIELYAEARKIFDQASAEQDDSFEREISRFRRANRWHDAVGSRAYHLAYRARRSRLVNRLRGS